MIPGFADPVLDAQATFRRVLEALAHPGRIVAIPAPPPAPAPLTPATAALCLTLVDFETPVWLDAGGDAAVWLRFHAGAPVVEDPGGAAFAVVCDPAALLPLGRFDPGTDADPDRSATLIVQLPALDGGERLDWSGPGIAGTVPVRPAGLPAGFAEDWADNHAGYPRGVDILFTCGAAVLGLPRGVRLGRG